VQRVACIRSHGDRPFLYLTERPLGGAEDPDCTPRRSSGSAILWTIATVFLDSNAVAFRLLSHACPPLPSGFCGAWLLPSSKAWTGMRCPGMPVIRFQPDAPGPTRLLR